MKKIFFTPGPSQLFPTVFGHIKEALKEDIASISHRGEKFQEIYEETVNNLKKLLKIPKNHKIYFLSSGTEAMERVIQNCVLEHSFHFVNGAFSRRFFEIAKQLGKNAKACEVKEGEGFDFQKVKVPKEAEVICLTQNETSTGVAIPPDLIYRLRRKYPDKLIAVDTVSSAPYVDLDYRYLDAVFFSVQKGFGLPAGLSVLIVSPKAVRKAKIIERKISIGSYHSFISMDDYAAKNQTPETPNVLLIYLLGQVCKDMLNSARHCLAEITRGTEEKAKLIYDFFERNKNFRIFVKEKKFRSNTVIVIESESDSLDIIKRLKTKGLIVGSGYGKFKNRHLRIANFPAHSLEDIRRLIEAMSRLHGF